MGTVFDLLVAREKAKNGANGREVFGCSRTKRKPAKQLHPF